MSGYYGRKVRRVVSIRLDDDELKQVQEASKLKDPGRPFWYRAPSVSEFIREAALAEAKRKIYSAAEVAAEVARESAALAAATSKLDELQQRNTPSSKPAKTSRAKGGAR